MNRAAVVAGIGLVGVAAYLSRGALAASLPALPTLSLPSLPGLDIFNGQGDATEADAEQPQRYESVIEQTMNAIPGQVDSNANRAAFLRMIRAAEGTDSENGYRYLFGSRPGAEKLFDSYADHPRQVFAFTQTDGKQNRTSAAGAYQILSGTWDRVRAKLSLPDFSPASQDAAALELIRGRGALADVDAGRFDVAVQKCAREWASLPGSPYAQRTRSWDFVRTAFANAGGTSVQG